MVSNVYCPLAGVFIIRPIKSASIVVIIHTLALYIQCLGMLGSIPSEAVNYPKVVLLGVLSRG
jgi:hypothetical protein